MAIIKTYRLIQQSIRANKFLDDYSKNMKVLLSLYWIIELHKQSIGTRVIIANKQSVIRGLSVNARIGNHETK